MSGARRGQAIVASALAALCACAEHAPAEEGHGAGGAGGSGGAGPTCGAPPPSGDDLFSQWAREVDAWRREHDIPGASVGVLAPGDAARVAAMGVREIGTCDPMTERTLFRSYFPSQRVAMLAALRLVEERALELDAPLAELVPEAVFDGTYAERPARVRHAVVGTTGAPAGFLRPGSLGAACAGDGSLAQAVSARAPLRAWFYAGDTLSESDLDLALLGLAVTRATHAKSYAAAAHELVLAPLGLDGAFTADELDGRERATPLAAEELCDAVGPVAGLHLTTGDLLRLYAAMIGDRLISPATRAAAFAGSPAFSPSGPQGWPAQGITLPDGEGLLVDVSDWERGVQSCVIAAPGSGLVVAAQLLQTPDPHRYYLWPCARALELFGGVAIVPYDRRADFAPYEGSYVDDAGVRFDVDVEDEALYLRGPLRSTPPLDASRREGASFEALRPGSAFGWFSDTPIPVSVDPDVFGALRFVRDQGGAVLGFARDGKMFYR